MKKILLTVLAFLSLGFYNVAMGQNEVSSNEKTPDLNNAGKFSQRLQIDENGVIAQAESSRFDIW